MKTARTLTAIAAMTTLSLASSALAQPNYLTDPSFESGTLGNFGTTLSAFTPGVWATERASVLGAVGAISPAKGASMLCMTNAGLAATQGVQVIDLSSLSQMIDEGCANIQFSALFNSAAAAAQASITLHYATTPVWAGRTSGPLNTFVLDANPSTWETLAVSDVIPPQTRWLVVEVMYSNASIGLNAGYVDEASLNISTNKLHNMLTVSNTNELMRVNLDTLAATSVGVTQDSAGGPVRRVRGLAFVGPTLYGMTREGDLVTIDPKTGSTFFVYNIATPGGAPQFWSGLTHRVEAGADVLYTANAFGGQELVRIDLSGPVSHTIQGPTMSPFGVRQILGVSFAMVDGVEMLIASNRQNQNVMSMDPTDGTIDFTWDNAVSGVNNNQQIGVHPGTGEIWGLFEYGAANSVVATYALDTIARAQLATRQGTLPFGIIESVGGGRDTYGWGGIAFVECRADFDCNGKVDFFDFLAFFNAYGAGDRRADCDRDGALTIFDYLCFIDTFGDCN